MITYIVRLLDSLIRYKYVARMRYLVYLKKNPGEHAPVTPLQNGLLRILDSLILCKYAARMRYFVCIFQNFQGGGACRRNPYKNGRPHILF